MRTKMALLAGVVLIGMTTATGQAQTPVEHASLVEASIVSPLCSSDDFASGTATGDVQGTFAIAFDCNGDTFSGGTWSVVVLGPDGDGAITDVEGLRGRVVNGAFQRDASGNVVSITGDVMIVEGTGAHATVSAGTGTFEATLDAGGTPQVRATLRLSF